MLGEQHMHPATALPIVKFGMAETAPGWSRPPQLLRCCLLERHSDLVMPCRPEAEIEDPCLGPIHSLVSMASGLLCRSTAETSTPGSS
jgi:hypothetical protein